MLANSSNPTPHLEGKKKKQTAGIGHPDGVAQPAAQ